MSKCSDYWCEHYGNGHNECDCCLSKDNEKDRPDLQVILQRSAVKQMELDKTSNRNRGQSR